MNFDDCPRYLKDFLFYLETIKGHSLRTVQAYYIDLKLFLKFINCKKVLNINLTELDTVTIIDIPLEVIKEITLSDLYEFLHFLLNHRQNSATTRNRKVSSLRNFFSYLHLKTKLIPNNPTLELGIASSKSSLPKYLNLEQSIELLTQTSQHMSPRDYCIITLFLNCGMRLSELVSMNWSNISEDKLTLLGKGNKERVIHLNEACFNAIENYKIQRNQHPHIQDKNVFFLGRGGKRITSRRVQQIVKKALMLANLDDQGYSPHKLRHTAATLMYQHNNVDIRVLQEILGHSNVSTTQIYTHVANHQVEHALKNSPLSKIKNK